MSFEFQLVLTERCNMACIYCYMKNKSFDMSEKVFDKHYKMLPKIMSFYNQNTYVAALFGGEPLLNWDLIEYITPILNSDPKCKFIIVMTNGLVLKDEYKRKYIEKNKIAISLSFDGLWNVNNRPLANGSPSLPEYISEPLKSYFSGKGGCKVMIAPSSVPTMVENFKWFVEEFGMSSPDFSLVRDDVWSEKDIEIYEIECSRLADQVIKYIKSGKRAMVGFFQLYILDLLFGEAYGKRPFGCFAACNGAGFMPNGRIYPCARFGSNNELAIADSHTGEIFENIKLLNKPEITNPRTYKKCKECTLYTYCNAGCTWQQIRNSKSQLQKSEPLDSICRLLHITYNESIRITEELKNNSLFKDIIRGAVKNVG